MALHVIRDKDTHEFIAIWPPRPADLPARVNYDTPAVDDLPDNAEYVVLQQMNIETVRELALAQAKQKEPDPVKRDAMKNAGAMRIHDTGIEALPPEPVPTLTDHIRAIKSEKGGNPNSPVALDELEEAERRVELRRMLPDTANSKAAMQRYKDGVVQRHGKAVLDAELSRRSDKATKRWANA